MVEVDNPQNNAAGTNSAADGIYPPPKTGDEDNVKFVLLGLLFLTLIGMSLVVRLRVCLDSFYGHAFALIFCFFKAKIRSWAVALQGFLTKKNRKANQTDVCEKILNRLLSRRTKTL